MQGVLTIDRSRFSIKISEETWQAIIEHHRKKYSEELKEVQKFKQDIASTGFSTITLDAILKSDESEDFPETIEGSKLYGVPMEQDNRLGFGQFCISLEVEGA